MMEEIFNKYLHLKKVAIFRKWFLDNNMRNDYFRDRYFVCEENFSHYNYIGHIQTTS